MFVVPERELECVPTAEFVDDDLAALEFRFIAIRDAADTPDLACRRQTAEVRPEDRAVFEIFGKFEDVFRSFQNDLDYSYHCCLSCCECVWVVNKFSRTSGQLGVWAGKVLAVVRRG